MKKLNRKGFTLVELLAVIIILAIVVGISIPAITSIINGSKNSALGVAVDSAADYLRDQFDIYNIDTTTAGPGFVSYMTDTTTGVGKNKTITSADDLFTEMGFDDKKVSAVEICVTATGSIYVSVTQIPTTSDYYTTEHWDTNGAPKASSDVKNTFGTKCSN